MVQGAEHVCPQEPPTSALQSTDCSTQRIGNDSPGGGETGLGLNSTVDLGSVPRRLCAVALGADSSCGGNPWQTAEAEVSA